MQSVRDFITAPSSSTSRANNLDSSLSLPSQALLGQPGHQLSSASTSAVTTLVQARNQIAYAICGHKGSIFLVFESRRAIRKANVISHSDIRMNNVVNILDKMIEKRLPTVSVTIENDAVVRLMYCHRDCQQVRSSSRMLYMVGKAAIIFDDHENETERRQSIHADICHCGSICQQPAEFDLKNGDQLRLMTGTFSIRVSSFRHTIYISKSKFINHVQYIPANAESNQEISSILDQI